MLRCLDQLRICFLPHVNNHCRRCMWKICNHWCICAEIHKAYKAPVLKSCSADVGVLEHFQHKYVLPSALLTCWLWLDSAGGGLLRLGYAGGGLLHWYNCWKMFTTFINAALLTVCKICKQAVAPCAPQRDIGFFTNIPPVVWGGEWENSCTCNSRASASAGASACFVNKQYI